MLLGIKNDVEALASDCRCFLLYYMYFLTKKMNNLSCSRASAVLLCIFCRVVCSGFLRDSFET